MRKGTLVAAATLALAATPAAGAHHHRRARHARPLPDPIAYMRKLAPKWWGMQACGGKYVVMSTPAFPGDPEAGARATFDGPAGPNIDAGGDPSLYTNCTITFLGSLVASWDAIYHDWLDFCTIFMHEYGHLTGHPHVQDPYDVMNPGAGADNGDSTPAVCLRSPTGLDWAPLVRLDSPDPGAYNAHHA